MIINFKKLLVLLCNFLDVVLGPRDQLKNVLHKLRARLTFSGIFLPRKAHPCWNLLTIVPTDSYVQSMLFVYLFIYLFIYLLAESCSWWDLSSQTRDWTQAFCSGSIQPYPLACQRFPMLYKYEWRNSSYAIFSPLSFSSKKYIFIFIVQYYSYTSMISLHNKYKKIYAIYNSIIFSS